MKCLRIWCGRWWKKKKKKREREVLKSQRNVNCQKEEHGGGRDEVGGIDPSPSYSIHAQLHWQDGDKCTSRMGWLHLVTDAAG